MWAAVNFRHYFLHAWQSGHSAVEKCCYLITYTVANRCGFWHCQGVISLPEIANSICGGTGCSCGCSAKPLWLHLTPRNAQTPAQHLDSCFIRVGSHGLPPSRLLVENSQENSIVFPLAPGSPLAKTHSCVPVWMCGNHDFADAPPNPVLLLLGGLQNLPMSWGFCFVSKGSVPGQWQGSGGVCCARLKEKTMFFILYDKKKSQREELLKS